MMSSWSLIFAALYQKRSKKLFFSWANSKTGIQKLFNLQANTVTATCKRQGQNKNIKFFVEGEQSVNEIPLWL